LKNQAGSEKRSPGIPSTLTLILLIIPTLNGKEEKYLDLEAQYRSRHLQRFLQQRKETAETHEVHMELLDLLKQINFYAGNIAKTILNSIPQK
jgi:phosphate:Na+ symporter